MLNNKFIVLNSKIANLRPKSVATQKKITL